MNYEVEIHLKFGESTIIKHFTAFGALYDGDDIAKQQAIGKAVTQAIINMRKYKQMGDFQELVIMYCIPTT